MPLHERLKNARIAAGLSQSELARRCGISQPSYSRWELETHIPTVDKALALSRELGVSIEWLVYGEDALPEPSYSGLDTPALREALNLTARRYREIEQALPAELLALLQAPTKETLPAFEKNLRVLVDKFSALRQPIPSETGNPTEVPDFPASP